MAAELKTKNSGAPEHTKLYPPKPKRKGPAPMPVDPLDATEPETGLTGRWADTYIIEVKGHAPPSLNRYMRMHWVMQRKQTDDWVLLVRAALNSQYTPETRPAGIKGCEITLTRHSPKGYLDLDNFIGGAKPVIDALKHNGIIHDDSPVYVQALHAKQERGPELGLRIEIKVLKDFEPERRPGRPRKGFKTQRPGYGDD